MKNKEKSHHAELERSWLEGLNAMGCYAGVKETHAYLKTCPKTLKYNPCVALAVGIFLGKCIGDPALASHEGISEAVKGDIFQMVNDIEAKFGIARDE